jgi:hypothetical protein
MLQHLRERYPHLSHKDLGKLAGQIGYDLTVSKVDPSKEGTTSEGTTSEGTTSGKLRIPQHWVDKTSESSGETLTVIGARRTP